jgi:hypothetical protein
VAIYDGIIFTPLIDTYLRDNTQINLGTYQVEPFGAINGTRDPVSFGAAFTPVTFDHATRDAIARQGVFMEDKDSRGTGTVVKTPRQTPLEIPWKKALFG